MPQRDQASAVSSRSSGGGTSRRGFLRASVGTAAGLAGWTLLGSRTRASVGAAAATPGPNGPASLVAPLSSDWLFGGEWQEGSDAPGYDDSGFTPVTLPHCVTPLPYNGWDPSAWEKLWIYRRHFDLPPQVSGLRTFLDFSGALTSVTPFINGTALARHQGGYLPFTYELTGQVHPTGNVLAVELDGTWQAIPPEGSPSGPDAIDYFEGAGINRDVSLRFVPQVFVRDVFAKPVNPANSAPEVDVEATVDLAAVPGEPVTVVAELLDTGSSEPLASVTAPVTATQPGTQAVSMTISGFGSAQLWSPSRPTLYEVVVTVHVGGKPVHDFTRRIGFREAVFAADGFFLNGERLKIFGLNRHQVFPYTAMAMPARVQRRDAELLKQLNCNMVRMSHYPQDPAFLDACDELGIMLWEETPGWQYIGGSTWQLLMLQNVQDMIVRDRSRPSVVIWGVKPDEASHTYTSLYTQAAELADSLDGSRPTSGTSYKTLDDFVFDVMARDTYNGRGGNAYLDPANGIPGQTVPPFAGVPYLITEAVGGLDGAPYYRWTDTQLTQAEQARMHAQVHNDAWSDDAISGVLAWCAVDYDSPHGNVYEQMKWPGVLDTFRVPKPGAAPYLAQADPSGGVVIEPAFYWDFGPASPVTTLGTDAMIWSNCDRIEAYLNETHYATLTPATGDTDEGTHQGYPYLAHAPFYLDTTGLDSASPPELRLDGYLGTSLALSRSFSGDTTGDKLSLTADDTSLIADGTDATRVAFRATDRYGAPRPYVTGDVTVTVDGPATWVGQVLNVTTSAAATAVAPGASTEVTMTLANGTFPFAANGGVGAVWIRTLPGQPGDITVTVTHPTFGSARARIHSAQPLSTASTLTGKTQPVNPVSAMTFTGVNLSLDTASNWTAQPVTATTAAELPPGSSVSATWKVASPASATPTSTVQLTATAAFTLNGSPVTQSAPVSLSVASAS